MLEQIITSKIRVKLLKFFLNNIDGRYYLRELERKLDESLSPLRRQLIRLTKLGILITEDEGNLKYYKLNKNFVGIEELRKLVMGGEEPQGVLDLSKPGLSIPALEKVGNEVKDKRMRFDVLAILVISFFVLATASFVVYTNLKNIREVVKLVSEVKPRTSERVRGLALDKKSPDEMSSKRWKILPGTVPVLSSGGTGSEKRVEEL